MPQELVLAPRFLERSIEPTIMGMDMMRVAENVDPTWLDGRLRRMEGYARTRITAATTTLLNIDIVERYDGARIFIDCDSSGNIRVTVPEGDEGCARSLVEYGDAADYTAIPLGENFDEETILVPDPETAGYHLHSNNCG